MSGSTSRRNGWGRVVVVIIAGGLVWLLISGVDAKASTDWQTIPTAPPPTTTLQATDMPTATLQKTATADLPIGAGATQTANPTFITSRPSATTQVGRESPTNVSTNPAGEGTNTPTGVTGGNPTGVLPTINKVSTETEGAEGAGGSGWYIAIGGAVLLLAVGGVAWLMVRRGRGV